MRILLIIGAICSLSVIMQGCFIAKKIAGADVDPEQFRLARDAAISEIRLKNLSALQGRLSNGDPLNSAGAYFYLSENLINKLAQQYIASEGWLDQTIRYKIHQVEIKIFNGSAIASLKGVAYKESAGIEVDITMDCLLSVNYNKEDLIIALEPFNIVPVVDGGILLSPAEEIISNLLLINIGGLSDTFEGIKIPIDFTNKIHIKGSTVKVREAINLNIKNPGRIIFFNLSLKEVLFFKGQAYIAFDISGEKVYE